MRRLDWFPRLWQTLEGSITLPFEFGTHDCVVLTARCLDAMQEASNWRGLVGDLYRDKRSAVRLIMRSGGLEALVSARLGESVPRNLARAGDVCALELSTGPAIGVCVGPRIAVASQPYGVEYLPLERAPCAWRMD